MNILNYTTRPASWQIDLQSAQRNELLEEMLNRFCTEEFLEANPELSKAEILQALIAREEMRTTAMGSSIAFPHARLEKLNRAFLAVGILPKPVSFENEPVQIVCLILAPASEPSTSLKMMAQLSRVLMDAEVRQQVLDVKTPEELRSLFKQHNPRIDKSITARDIMRPPRFSVEESDRVSTCSHLMSVNNMQAVPVVDEMKKIRGEITVDRLFRYGLPDFFAQLKSVSFIAEFDPFEKYFEDERDMLVSDIMTPEALTVPLDYTIMEIVFELTIKSVIKLYVVDENDRWVGTIDKSTLLDNVINY
ncbi:MAG: PTS sugar transporter subunit IIA [Kiritimatiellales bacterium]|nr:PTS sugar transporter subunit IIA [Kiritimatiellota bacterium]MBL7012589.1 PTS sugar transporter subunit IIA [Kiritimatiellales bacterium]